MADEKKAAPEAEKKPEEAAKKDTPPEEKKPETLEEKAARSARVPQKRRAVAPTTRVKSSGRLNRRLEELERVYLKENPGMSVRWVYDPKHKPDLSNILSRQVDGFVLVLVKDLGEGMALPGMKPDEPVRVGDTVLMAIAAADAREMRAELDRLASDEMTRVEQEFRQSVEEISAVKGGKVYSPRPVGVSVTEEVEQDVQVPPTHSES